MPGRQHLSADEAPPLTEDTPAPRPPEDPLRRIALIATAVLVPVVLAAVILVNVLGGREVDDDGRGPAAIDGSTPSQREDLPVLPVEVPPATPEAEASCPGLMGRLPLELAGEASRRVQSDTPYAYAWGEPPIVLICGVDRPAGFVVGVSAIQINGVQWYVDTSDPDVTVWTTVDRPVYVQMSLPPEVDSAPVTALTPEIAAALEYREPDPGE
ncbi:DUF3515 domain-containing protein [Blastococcus haudaquaticus]|uniref:DUF3515 domain-containing protein n=1 Tax=Blastococcus haudaquaticus TaxID=1938745 RepID=A0A286GC10_9ACTN|nr:DUF3515 domain-containing protein [Blastococcus haudaquaticus]SOD93041.1 Protein of unknown function [Blastococcus haudaquaticus]